MSDMWRWVVAQAIRDMDLGRRQQNEETIRIQLDAVQWIGTEDFRQCCACALIDPRELEERLREILLMRPPYRRLILRDLASMISEPPPTRVETEASLDAGLVAEPELDSGD